MTKTLYEITGRITDVNTMLVNRTEIDELRAENARLSALCDKWNFECDAMREDNKRLAGEESAFEAWLEDKRPTGDSESVARQWEQSSELADFLATAAGAAPVPDGWKLVPDCITDEMLEALLNGMGLFVTRLSIKDAQRGYKAMLAASPKESS